MVFHIYIYLEVVGGVPQGGLSRAVLSMHSKRAVETSKYISLDRHGIQVFGYSHLYSTLFHNVTGQFVLECRRMVFLFTTLGAPSIQ